MISNFGQANLVSTEFELPTYLDLRFRLWEIQFGYVRVSDVSGNFVFRKKKQFGQSLRKRKNICDEIETRGIIRPRTNHYR